MRLVSGQKFRQKLLMDIPSSRQVSWDQAPDKKKENIPAFLALSTAIERNPINKTPS